jgi:protein-disulfide isomerase
MDSPEGFRRIAGGQITASFDPFIGIDRPADARDPDPARIAGRLCEALFGGSASEAGVVPVASFSDYNCPFCRVLTQRLADLEEEAGGAVRITWHELPLLGPSSVAAARGALAAGNQGAYAAFHRRLMRSRFEATPDYLTVLAGDLGIDADRLIADMDSRDVTDQILDSIALSRQFAFAGTPALVVGRTAVEGQISEDALRRLIAIEADAGPVPGCT